MRKSVYSWTTSQKETQETTTLEHLDELVEQRLTNGMRNSNGKACMQDHFSSYVTLLARNGLKWLIEENYKVAVYHVLSAVYPFSRHDRFKSDLSFSKHSLRKDSYAFLAHAIHLAEAFQRVESDPRSSTGNDKA